MLCLKAELIEKANMFKLSGSANMQQFQKQLKAAVSLLGCAWCKEMRSGDTYECDNVILNVLIEPLYIIAHYYKTQDHLFGDSIKRIGLFWKLDRTLKKLANPDDDFESAGNEFFQLFSQARKMDMQKIQRGEDPEALHVFFREVREYVYLEGVKELIYDGDYEMALTCIGMFFQSNVDFKTLEYRNEKIIDIGSSLLEECTAVID